MDTLTSSTADMSSDEQLVAYRASCQRHGFGLLLLLGFALPLDFLLCHLTVLINFGFLLLHLFSLALPFLRRGLLPVFTGGFHRLLLFFDFDFSGALFPESWTSRIVGLDFFSDFRFDLLALGLSSSLSLLRGLVFLLRQCFGAVI